MRTSPTDILWQALAIFFLIGALLGILLGLLLVFKPEFLDRLNPVANRWVTMRRITKWLDRSIDIEGWFYQYHSVAGIAVALGAAYILIYFGFLFDKPYMLRHLGNAIPPALLGGLLDALVLSLLAGGAAALAVGLFLWLRPGLLHGVEVSSNRWLSLRQATKAMDVPRGQVDRFVVQHAQQSGWLLLLGSGYLLFAMFRLLA